MSLPAIDAFTGTAGALAGSWTQQRSGGGVTVNRNGAGLITQSATNASGVIPSFAYWNADVFADDQSSQLVVKSLAASTSFVGVGVRMTGTSDATITGYVLLSDGAGALIGRVDAGVTTQLAGGFTTYAANDVLTLTIVGSTLTAYKNGTAVGSATDSTYTSGRAGVALVWVAGSAPTADDWQGDAIATASTLTASVGALTLAGQAVGLRVSRRLSATVGSVALTGQSVTLRRGVRLAASVGTVTLAGPPVTLRVARRLAASVGTVSLAGPAVTLRRRYTLVAAPGAFAELPDDGGPSFVLTGSPVTLTYTPASRVLSAGTGAVTLAGQTVTLRVGRRMSAGAGAVAVTGLPVRLAVARRLAASVGTITLTGSPVALSTASSRTLVAARGTRTLAGAAVRLTVGRRLSVTGGVFTVTGLPVTLTTAGTTPDDTPLLLLGAVSAVPLPVTVLRLDTTPRVTLLVTTPRVTLLALPVTVTRQTS